MTTSTAQTTSCDALDVIEEQAAMLVRNFEMLRRRSTDGQLDRAGYLLLRALQRLGPSDINTLACALGLDPSTAGRQVAAVEADGLVRRKPAPNDRRRSIIDATAEGRRRMRRTSEKRRRIAADLLDDWSDEDQRLLGEMFTRYNAAVAKHYLTDSE